VHHGFGDFLCTRDADAATLVVHERMVAVPVQADKGTLAAEPHDDVGRQGQGLRIEGKKLGEPSWTWSQQLQVQAKIPAMSISDVEGALYAVV
jgi:hypothetical protein